MSTKTIRKRSLAQAKKLGYPINPALPLLEAMELRPLDEVLARTLALDAALSCAYGHPPKKTREWLQAEGLTNSLSPREAKVLRGDKRAAESVQVQVECLWAFAWALGHVPKLDFGRLCGDNLIQLVPDLNVDEGSAAFRAASQLRKADEIIAACDLAYCLHWAVRECALHGQPAPGKVHGHVVVERRRAFEWLLGAQDWDDVALDT